MVGFRQVNGNHVRDLKNTRSQQLSTLNRSWRNVEKFRHMASVVTPNGCVLGTGNNYMLNGIPISNHAEPVALRKALQNIIRKKGRNRCLKGRKKVIIYVVRDNGRNSRPCNDCITNHICDNPYFNIKKVIYTHENGVDGTITETTKNLFENRYAHITRHFRNLGVESPMDMIDDCEHGCLHGLDEIEEGDEEDNEAKHSIIYFPHR